MEEGADSEVPLTLDEDLASNGATREDSPEEELVRVEEGGQPLESEPSSRKVTPVNGSEEVAEDVNGNEEVAGGDNEEGAEEDKEAAGVKLEGIEANEEEPLEHTELELLSQHISGDIYDVVEEDVVDDGDDFEQDENVLLEDPDPGYNEQPSGLSPEYRVFDRDTLIQQYKEALEERAKIQQSNQLMQNKLSEYFKKKKTEERGQEIEKNANDQEQRYLKYMSNLEELQKLESQQSASIKVQLEEVQRKCTDMEKRVEDASNEFVKFKYDTAADAINSRSGKHIPAKDLEQYQAQEAKKEQEVIAVRLENIKLKNRLKKREQQLKAKEELAEGLHLIDFEQLKIENQTYHEKIEERNEELLKLRTKIRTTVQVLTHLKEKLQFVQGENGEQRSKLRDIEVTVAHKRDILTRLKQVRDGLRMDNNKLKHKAGLLGNKPLLKDYEVRKDEGEELQVKLDTLKKQHVDLNLALQGVKKKIDKSKPPLHAL